MCRDKMLALRLQLNEEMRLLGEERDGIEKRYRINMDNLDREMREIRNKLQAVERSMENERIAN